jgi:hypothetical protein
MVYGCLNGSNAVSIVDYCHASVVFISFLSHLPNAKAGKGAGAERPLAVGSSQLDENNRVDAV